MARDEDSYPFISVAEDYLAAVPHDDQVRALLVGALVRKGLLSVAAELARGCPQASPNAVELHAAADQLIRSASEKVDWSTTDGRFTANLAGLRSRDGAGEILADQVEQTWQQLAPGLTLYKANDGNVQVRAVKSDGRGLWVPAALDYNGKVEALVDTDGWKGRILSPFLLEGVGIGAWFRGCTRPAAARISITARLYTWSSPTCGPWPWL